MLYEVRAGFDSTFVNKCGVRPFAKVYVLEIQPQINTDVHLWLSFRLFAFLQQVY
ncbi:hypothetical protein PQG02_06705 [Nostoc sp. UHCC 0926]|uniref:hypothetical protein n=1 Tax=unclassified Nostoc TaxID=2593658 RepID=UPI002361C9A8|nr:hypothetical protein [Nostoc sp. UHCC 0926]WDD34036.1 hypothetical protein PQG02_06705 [Nostoc sp. UHCC 0926]